MRYNKDIKDKIKNELIKKTQTTYGFFGFFRRDETTVALYRTLLKEAEESSVLNLKDRGCAPEVAIFDGVKEGHQGRIPNA